VLTGRFDFRCKIYGPEESGIINQRMTIPPCAFPNQGENDGGRNDEEKTCNYKVFPFSPYC
jgi:hypothetical protein